MRSVSKSTHGHRSDDRGFTLIEIIAILAILAILTGFALPRINVGRARVDGGIFELSARLMEAQRRAVLRQHDIRVIFDVADGSILVHEDSNNDGVRASGETWAQTDLAEGTVFGTAGAPPVGTGPAGPVTFAVDPTESLPVLTFHRNGSASEAGTVYMASGGQNTSDDARAIEIHRSTGRAICWTHRTGTWTEGC